MPTGSILFMFHCEQFTGYAIGALEHVFLRAAIHAGYSTEQIHWSYSQIIEPAANIHKIAYNNNKDIKALRKLIVAHQIKMVFAFDLPYPTDVALAARDAGIQQIVSYWGASMSSLNSRLRLLIKRLEWSFRKTSAPSHFIFESEAMRHTATHGRGVPFAATSVVPLGVDTDIFTPKGDQDYAHRELNIPRSRNIIFYSGHMEERKGVRTIMEAAIHLSNMNQLTNIHFLICGNRNGEEKPFTKMIADSPAHDHVTFAGYRHDIPHLMRSCDIGVIASTGWDSFTMSSVEMMASGLPLIVSNLQGLAETIVPGHSGEYITPGDSSSLAEKILVLVTKNELLRSYSDNARQRAVDMFSVEDQIVRLSSFMKIV